MGFSVLGFRVPMNLQECALQASLGLAKDFMQSPTFSLLLQGAALEFRDLIAQVLLLRV